MLFSLRFQFTIAFKLDAVHLRFLRVVPCLLMVEYLVGGALLFGRFRRGRFAAPIEIIFGTKL